MTDASAADAFHLVVVFDSSVLIPMIIPASRSARLFERLLAARIPVAVTPQILAEVEAKLRTKPQLRQWLGVSDTDIDLFLDRLQRLCRLLSGSRQAHGAVPTDPKDDIIIAAALEAQADYLVSEDRHLLDLGSFQGIQIVNRVQLTAELDRLGVPPV